MLGLTWDCENDTLHFNFQHIADKAKGLEATKRNVLSLLASLFNPLGMVRPVTVGMKVLFQEICKSKFHWDAVLTGEIKRKWDKWVQDLAETKEICINRCLYETEGGDVTDCYLHGFGDASKKAYCAMVYFVYRTKDGKAHVRLVAGKTRVASLKKLSIPRLELMSVRILAQLMHTVKNALQSQVKLDVVRFWLDSKTALSWIQNKGEWKQFVRHRVNEILKLTDKEDWAYCSTEENPADLGSRGVLASQLKENQLWWCGPSWLTERPEDWPVLTESLRTPESLIEEKKSAAVIMTKAEIVSGISGVIDVNDYSTLQRLVRVTAWIKRFMGVSWCCGNYCWLAFVWLCGYCSVSFQSFVLRHWCPQHQETTRFIDNSTAKAKQNEKRTGRLKADELKCAEIEWLKSVQSELEQQTNFKQLVSELGIKEDRAILRCEGRLVNSDLESEARRPLILPRQHRFTRLVIEECHQRVHHSGVRATLAELRSR